MPDLASERMDYDSGTLREESAPTEPYALFDAWLADAFEAKAQGRLPEPTAMVVATSLGDRPSSRTVLLKAVEDGTFVFFSNYDSAKGHDLVVNPYVALHFGWYPLQRQVRVEGLVRRVPREESEAYFATRPRGSQLGAWASAQSSEVSGVEELEAAYARVERRFDGVEVPCPPHWGGFRVVPSMIEFWQGQPSRMHDRLRYDRVEDAWRRTRLAP
ncbi:Pyridoxamine 5'-phosphate oxidase [Microlunatus sagamiharensis]|uniref:Pyridoxine/pyridoxamine 5'-phosphate oxidase n=1 Tax=Microlunatus sagamiharensis TaxID=546874 RepID=A0A1H2LI55_9ACTN|nr:pyridoxamine 5'-phosphate oxidase [Microlunatus sagamiharensis]SDU80251.1 Pyridoxamine 5'-phosphate oxidase [Microlunatus sagamiharensis]